MRRGAVNIGLVDRPGGDALKIHGEPVALLGGLAVMAAAGAGLLFVQFFIRDSSLSLIWRIVPGTAAIFAVGLWDDVRRRSAWLRLIVHIGAAVSVAYLCVPGRVPWSVFLIIALVVSLSVNACNMFDGMDGLCAGAGIISCLGFSLIGISRFDMIPILIAGCLGMGLIGFLPYNFHPARIFLGDAGSGSIGFLLGVLAILSIRDFSLIQIAASLLIIGLPVVDLVWAVLRRTVRKRPLFGGDRDHLYDLLLKKGSGQVAVWFLLCGAQVVLVGTGLILYLY